MDRPHSLQKSKGVLIPLSPPRTPWPAKKAGMDEYWSSSHNEGVNVQVVLRCRPLSKDEMEAQTPVAISCNEDIGEVSAILSAANKNFYRTFTFDKVFGPTSSQEGFYDKAIAPLVDDALEGYNCTIFAYGQTGTGKTYTMEGGMRAKKDSEFQDEAGLIPRAIQQIFGILGAQHEDYSIKVTYLELYNEEITDLLGTDESVLRRPIALLDDGKGSVLVRGLEEERVCSPDEIHGILEKGSTKQSNRSHLILSILIHTRECAVEGHELIKSAKLNLVDLAGSENIYRSGAKETTAREAGEINKSLLTLGRVINALFEHSGHVPYRDSKLTRLLRDSLGGKTKTCIIATISPSIHCLDETLSTLDYAHRAKNIQNRPEVNRKIIKSSLVKDLYKEIDRLKREIHAAREKYGICTPQNHYQNEEAQKKTPAEKLAHMEHDSAIKHKHLAELEEMYNHQRKLTVDQSEKLEKIQRAYEQIERAFFDLEHSYRLANATIEEKEYMISDCQRSENALGEQSIELQAELENAASELSRLLARIEHKSEIEEGNTRLIQNFQAQLAYQLETLHKTISSFITQQEHQLKGMEENMHHFLYKKSEATGELKMQLGNFKDSYSSGVTYLNELARELYESSQLAFANLSSELSRHSSSFADTMRTIFLEANCSLNDLQIVLHNEDERMAAYEKQQNEIHSERLQTKRFVSEIAANFFKTFSANALNLTQIIEDSQCINDQKLYELEKKFEECAANEERWLVDNVAELIASSNARKKRLLQAVVQSLKESTGNRTFKLKQELSNIKDFTSSFKDDSATYMNQISSDAIVEKTGKSSFKEDSEHCVREAALCAKKWRESQESVLSLQEQSTDFIKSIVR